MKRILKALIVPVVLVCSFSNLKAQTADDIIQKHFAAIGGVDNWKKINTMKTTASMTANGMEIPLIITVQQNKAMRMELTINGMTGYSIITDKTGWNYMPFGGQTKPEVVPDEQVKQMQDGLDLQGPLVDYKTKGNKVTYLGKDDVEGTDCYKLKVVYTSGMEETMYFDATNYYHIRSVQKVTANGKEESITKNFSNYQKTPEGILYPMSIDMGMGAMNVKSVEINKPVDASIFKPTEMSSSKETKK